MKKETITATFLILVLSGLWLFFNRSQDQLVFYIVDLPYFVLFTWMVFMLGLPAVSQGIRYGTKSSLTKTIFYPFTLIILYYLYLWIHGQLLMQGASLLLPYLIVFPVLAFYHRALNYKFVTWWDLIILILFLVPVALIDIPENSDLPIQGVHFDSVFRMVMVLTAVYAFVVVRRLQGVGFWVDPSWRKLWTTVWVWIVLIGIIAAIGVGMNYLSFEGFSLNNIPDWEDFASRFLTIFLHTALFEELFFRGLMQNILAKKVRQSSSPFLFWMIGGIVMAGLALLTGLLMREEIFWFPFIITLILFVGAYILSNIFAGFRHHYLALAITSVVFGLVHFHTGSVVYVGMAILAGWAYGYVYWRTKSVFYAALLHAMINISPLILGFEMMT